MKKRNNRREVKIVRRTRHRIVLVGIAVVPMALVGVAVCCLYAGEYRFWTTAQGRRSDVKLEVVEQSDGRVKLKRQDDGRVVELPIEQLSDDDQAYLRELEVRSAPAAVGATNTNWPRFRGPNGLGVSNERGLPTEWSATKNIVWRTELPGPGASSPIVWDDHVYVTCYSGYGVSAETPGNLDDLTRHLVCVDKNDGRIVWDKSIASQVREQPFEGMILRHGYASSTPVADEAGVYVFYGASGAAAYGHDGSRKWHRSCGTSTQHYGSATSPILVDDLLIIDASVEGPGYPGQAALLALDKRTGDEVWQQSHFGGGAYLTPTLVEIGDNRQLVVSQPWGHAIVGASPETGERLWQCNVSAYTPTPVIDEQGILYVLSKTGYAAIRTGGSGQVSALWEVNSPVYRQSSPLCWQGHLYWVPMDLGIACCVSAETGETVYRERINPPAGQVYASPILADGKIYYVTRENGTYVLPARPEFEILAHNVIETDQSVFNGSPAVSGGRIYLRSDQFLYCIGE